MSSSASVSESSSVSNAFRHGRIPIRNAPTCRHSRPGRAGRHASEPDFDGDPQKGTADGKAQRHTCEQREWDGLRSDPGASGISSSSFLCSLCHNMPFGEIISQCSPPCRRIPGRAEQSRIRTQPRRSPANACRSSCFSATFCRFRLPPAAFPCPGTHCSAQAERPRNGRQVAHGAVATRSPRFVGLGRR